MRVILELCSKEPTLGGNGRPLDSFYPKPVGPGMSICIKSSRYCFELCCIIELTQMFLPVIYSFFFKFFYSWLHWVFVAARRLSLVAASRGCSSLRSAGFSLRWLLLLWSTGSRSVGFSSRGSRALERRLSSCGARA